MLARDGETSTTECHGDADDDDAEGVSLLRQDHTEYGEDEQEFDNLSVLVASDYDDTRGGES
jgi:hypothetical protein